MIIIISVSRRRRPLNCRNSLRDNSLVVPLFSAHLPDWLPCSERYPQLWDAGESGGRGGGGLYSVYAYPLFWVHFRWAYPPPPHPLTSAPSRRRNAGPGSLRIICTPSPWLGGRSVVTIPETLQPLHHATIFHPASWNLATITSCKPYSILHPEILKPLHHATIFYPASWKLSSNTSCNHIPSCILKPCNHYIMQPYSILHFETLQQFFTSCHHIPSCILKSFNHYIMQSCSILHPETLQPLDHATIFHLHPETLQQLHNETNLHPATIPSLQTFHL